jgi:hypothetical protein
MEHIIKHYQKRQTGKIFLLSKLIDVSSVSCTIILINMSPLRELRLGLSICFDMDWIQSLKSQEIIDSYITKS